MNVSSVAYPLNPLVAVGYATLNILKEKSSRNCSLISLNNTMSLKVFSYTEVTLRAQEVKILICVYALIAVQISSVAIG